MTLSVPDPTSDLLRLADGDRSAFDAVYAACQPRVLALTRRMMAGDPECEDVAQQALLRVFERASEYQPELGKGMPWVLGIAAWEVRSWRTRRRRRGHGPLDPEHPQSQGPTVEATVAQAQLLAHLEGILDGLEEADHATLMAAAGLAPRPEGLAPATFRKRVQRAMTRLRLAWSDKHG